MISQDRVLFHLGELLRLVDLDLNSSLSSATCEDWDSLTQLALLARLSQEPDVKEIELEQIANTYNLQEIFAIIAKS
jgi:hypothetical protein